MGFAAYTMEKIRLLALIVTLAGVATSRPISVDLLTLDKIITSSNGDQMTKEASINNSEDEIDVLENGEIIVIGRLKGLENYKIEIYYNEGSKNVHSKLNLAGLVKEKINKSQEKEEKYKPIRNRRVKEFQKKNNANKYLNFFEEYEEDTIDETDDKENKVDIFNEDEYDDYDDKDEANDWLPSQEVNIEVDKSYDEDEKYYELREDQYESSKEEEDFDGEIKGFNY